MKLDSSMRSMDLQRSELEAEVLERLDNVIDPELDEPVTTMGFIEAVKVGCDEQLVEVEFRLPTYWCSPNFAFLMAFDMRIEIEKLDWVGGVKITLNDHCFGDRINDGVNGNRDFSDVFAEYCNGEDLTALRKQFQEKAFIRRQESVLLALKKQGLSDVDIVEMTMETFDSIDFDDEEAKKQKPRYRSILMSRGLANTKFDSAFVTWTGKGLTATGLQAYLSHSRGVRINMEFNGALCRGLKDARYKELVIEKSDSVPIKFIRNVATPSAVTGGK